MRTRPRKKNEKEPKEEQQTSSMLSGRLVSDISSSERRRTKHFQDEPLPVTDQVFQARSLLSDSTISDFHRFESLQSAQQIHRLPSSPRTLLLTCPNGPMFAPVPAIYTPRHEPKYAPIQIDHRLWVEQGQMQLARHWTQCLYLICMHL